MKYLTIQVPDEVEETKIKMIIAASLFEQGILSTTRAAELAGVTRRYFIEEIGKYGISIFGETEEDIEEIDEVQL